MIQLSKKCENFLNSLYEIIKSINCPIYEGQIKNQDLSTAFLFFRGESKYGWSLEPKICRKNNKETNEIDELDENHKEYMFANAQHYGKTTRTIDFSSNLNVALYFACASHKESNGALYLLKYAPYAAGWAGEHIMRVIAKTDLNKTVFSKDLAQVLAEDSAFLKACKKKDYNLYTEIKECKKRNSVMKSLCVIINNVLKYGFLTVFNYKNCKINKRLRLQKGALFYCGSHFYCKEKNINLITNTRFASDFKINIHKVKKTLWITKDMLKLLTINNVEGTGNKMLIKIRIPKNLKEEILTFTGLNQKKLGFDSDKN